MAARKGAKRAAVTDTSMNDEELREDLKRFGQNVGPITDTTRSILQKKLNHLRAAQRKERRGSLKGLNRRNSEKFFSSDESGTDTPATSRATTSRAAASRRKSSGVVKIKNKKTKESISLPVTPPRRKRTRIPNNSIPLLPSSGGNGDHNQTPLSLPSIDDRFSGTDDEEEVDIADAATNTSLIYSDDNNTPILKKRIKKTTNANHSPSNSSAYHDDADDVLKSEFLLEEDLTATFGSKYGHIISIALVVIVVIFFLTLGVIYLTVEIDDDDTVISDKLQLCSDSSDSTECPTSSTLKDKAMYIVNHMYDELCLVAGNYECSNGESKNISLDTARNWTSTKLSDVQSKPTSQDVAEVLDESLKLIIAHPVWGIRLYDNDLLETNITANVQWLDSEHPHMSIWCRITRSIASVFFRIMMLFIVIVVSWGMCAYIRYRWRREEEEQRQVYEMVEKIIDILKTHHDSCRRDQDLQHYLAIPHVRDMLLQPADRQKLGRIWDKAVKFLESSESRVRVESQCISGEDFAVWRWIQVMSTAKDDEFPPKKQWQGQAFENLETAVNTPAYSPTSCLKIRNMFDPSLEHGDNWHTAIQEAVLEKCSDNDGIVHIAVDRTSKEGCVYIKCNSSQSTGKAFKSLHGCWFDGKLVTVKYLRLDRYHQRFPSALQATTPIKMTPSLTPPSPSLSSSSSTITVPDISQTPSKLYPSLEGL